jgi:2-C-methyl-D-erythritol 4-phosphate cytidylyltransferase/2-C-methyl-D-erythritol 2,4-cyclodiphosphate synthase
MLQSRFLSSADPPAAADTRRGPRRFPERPILGRMDGAFADAVIVAAGSSQRMGGVDKLGAILAGRPLLAWSVESLAAARSVRSVVVVAAPDRVKALSVADWMRAVPATVVVGGETRSASVLAGVRACHAEVVLVHDGARPLVSSALADAVAVAAAEHGAAIPTIPISDSLKTLTGATVNTGNGREGLVGAQTPQAARRALLLEAFAAADGRSFSDEAGLLQAHGVAVVAVPGEATNLKVTRPGDLELVRAIALARSGSAIARTGFGQDSHQFGRADGLYLGGIFIGEAPRLHGHSDGDVALHAIATGLLAAAGLGDLGRLFPSDDPATAGADSADLLREASARVATLGWMPSSVQLALLGARPRLGSARLEAMRVAIAKLLALESEAIAVTASTGNLIGAEGHGLGISATALVTVVPV